jgi:hypothetical protein
MLQVRRDTVKTVRHSKIHLDTTTYYRPKVDLDTQLIVANKESFEAVVSGAYIHPKPLKILTAFDTIQPCDVSLFEAGTYYVPKSIPVRKTAEMESPMNYDILANGVVFTFMLLLSAKYIITCIPAWKALISDLKHIA